MRQRLIGFGSGLAAVLATAWISGCTTVPEVEQAVSASPVEETEEVVTADQLAQSTFLGPAPEDPSPITTPPAVEDDREALEAEAEALGIILAARYGHENIVRLLLDRGVDVDQQDELGNTPLIAVAGEGHTSILRLLLERGANVHLSTNDGTTALMNAAANGRLEHVRLLLQAGARLDRRNQAGETALIQAIKFGRPQVVDFLLAQGADPNLYSQEEVQALDRMTPLMYAAEYGGVVDGSTAITRALLEYGAEPNITRRNGDTALAIAKRKGYRQIATLLRSRGGRDESLYAALSAEEAMLKAIRLGDVEKVRLLLETATDPNYRDPITGVTPLLTAAYYGNLEATQLLIRHGADIDDVPWGLTEARIRASSVPIQQRDLMWTASRGDTALITAIRRGHSDVARLLLEAGADPLQPNRLVETPGLFAARKGDAAVMRLLIAKGLDPDEAQAGQLLDYFIANIIDEQQLRPLLIEAAANGHADTARVLLEAGADPDIRDAEGKTALFWAASQGFTPTVQLLLEAGANPDLPDLTGMNPLMAAAKNGFRRVVALLLENGAEVNAVEESGRPFEREDSRMTALAYATRGGHTEIVRLLLEHGADSRLRNAAGETPLDIARKSGYADIVQLLDRQVAVSPF